MLHFRIDMPFYLMAFYGSIMIVAVLLLRAFLKNKLPKFVFPVLWGVVLLRLLVPFSLSSPLSLPVPEGLFGISDFSLAQLEETAHDDEMTWATEDVPQLQPGTGKQTGAAGATGPSTALENPDRAGEGNIEQTVVEEVMVGAVEESSV